MYVQVGFGDPEEKFLDIYFGIPVVAVVVVVTFDVSEVASIVRSCTPVFATISCGIHIISRQGN